MGIFTDDRTAPTILHGEAQLPYEFGGIRGSEALEMLADLAFAPASVHMDAFLEEMAPGADDVRDLCLQGITDPGIEAFIQEQIRRVQHDPSLNGNQQEFHRWVIDIKRTAVINIYLQVMKFYTELGTSSAEVHAHAAKVGEELQRYKGPDVVIDSLSEIYGRRGYRIGRLFGAKYVPDRPLRKFLILGPDSYAQRRSDSVITFQEVIGPGGVVVWQPCDFEVVPVEERERKLKRMLERDGGKQNVVQKRIVVDGPAERIDMDRLSAKAILLGWIGDQIAGHFLPGGGDSLFDMVSQRAHGSERGTRRGTLSVEERDQVMKILGDNLRNRYRRIDVADGAWHTLGGAAVASEVFAFLAAYFNIPLPALLALALIHAPEVAIAAGAVGTAALTYRLYQGLRLEELQDPVKARSLELVLFAGYPVVVPKLVRRRWVPRNVRRAVKRAVANKRALWAAIRTERIRAGLPAR